jgi:hypothetical protein
MSLGTYRLLASIINLDDELLALAFIGVALAEETPMNVSPMLALAPIVLTLIEPLQILGVSFAIRHDNLLS